MNKRQVFPSTLKVELTSIFPRYVCYVSSPYPHRYFKGFKSHTELYAWIAKHGYLWSDVR